MVTQLAILFAFGLVVTGIVFLGIVQAQDFRRRVRRERRAESTEPRTSETRRGLRAVS